MNQESSSFSDEQNNEDNREKTDIILLEQKLQEAEEHIQKLLIENAAYKTEIEQLQQQIRRSRISNLGEIEWRDEVQPSSDENHQLIHITTMRPTGPKRRYLPTKINLIPVPQNMEKTSEEDHSLEKEKQEVSKISHIPLVSQIAEERHREVNTITDEVKSDHEELTIVCNDTMDIISNGTTPDPLIERSSHVPPKPGGLEKKVVKGFRIFGDYNPEVTLKPSVLRSKIGKATVSHDSEIPNDLTSTERLCITDPLPLSMGTTLNVTDGEKLECCEWIEKITEEKLKDERLEESLKDGVLLCKLLNKLKPGTIKRIHTLKFPAAYTENVQSYIVACTSLGWCTINPFDIVDVTEMRNTDKVIRHLLQVRDRFHDPS